VKVVWRKNNRMPSQILPVVVPIRPRTIL